MVQFKLSLLVGIMIASPVIFWQIWKFIAPGLHSNERRWGFAFIFTSVILFVGGVLFAYFFVLPASYKYFLDYAAKDVGTIKNVFSGSDMRLSIPFDIKPMISMEEYYSLTWTLLLIFGVVFELPLVLAMLGIMGVVSAGQLWRFNKFAIMIAAVLGAVVTPGDLVLGQIAMTGSLTVLYNISILIVYLVGRKKKDELPVSTALVK